VAVVPIGTLEQNKRVHRRQQDDLPAHIKGKAYFKYYRPGHKDTRYYIDLPKKSHGAVEFVKVEDKDYWVKLLWKDNQWYTNQGGVLHTSKLGHWEETDPQHPHYVNPEHYSPTLHTTIEQSPHEEVLAGGIHHIATLQGTNPFTEQIPILPQIKTAVQQGVAIPLDTIPATAVQPQLSIQTTMTEQPQEINVATGQSEQEVRQINVVTSPANSALKGNPPPIFNGDRSTTRKFINNFDLWKAIN